MGGFVGGFFAGFWRLLGKTENNNKSMTRSWLFFVQALDGTLQDGPLSKLK